MVGDFPVCNIVMMCVLFYGEILWIGDFPVCDISFRKESRSDSKFVGGGELGVCSTIGLQRVCC